MLIKVYWGRLAGAENAAVTRILYTKSPNPIIYIHCPSEPVFTGYAMLFLLVFHSCFNVKNEGSNCVGPAFE